MSDQCDVIDVVDELKKEGFSSHFTVSVMLNILIDGFNENHFDRISRTFKNEFFARRHAFMNLLGYLGEKHKKIGYYEAIKKYFKIVLDEDPNNLNALLNMVYAYQQLGKSNKVSDYKEKITNILLDKDLAKSVKTRAKYEQAEAMATLDGHKQLIYVEEIEQEYEYALKNTGNSSEHLAWEFDYAHFNFKCDSLYGSHNLSYFKRALHAFYKVANIKETSPRSCPQTDSQEAARIETRRLDMIAKAWVFMASLLVRNNRGDLQLKDVIEDVLCSDHLHYTAFDCMALAMESLTEVNKPVILRRGGQVYMELKKMEDSKKCLEEAILIDGENGYGHYLMGRWFKQSNDLDKAIECYERALGKGCDLWHLYRSLAEAHYSRREFDAAARRCSESELHGGNNDKELFELWSKVLRELGKYEAAKTKQDHVEQLEEERMEDVRDFGAIYCIEDVDTVLTVAEEAKQKRHLTVYCMDVEVLSGEFTVERWGELEKRSKYVLVFFSKKFQGSVGYHALAGIMTNESKLSKVIPVLLPGFSDKDLPSQLKSKKHLQYDDWDKDKRKSFYQEITKIIRCHDEQPEV